MAKLLAIAFAMLLAAGGALAQDQNAAQTGVGQVMQSLDDAQETLNEYWEGRPGAMVKYSVGLAGAAAALSAAKSAVTWEGIVRSDGSTGSGSAVGTESSGTDSTTTTSTTSTTSTN